jgi:hypothetical protein
MASSSPGGMTSELQLCSLHVDAEPNRSSTSTSRAIQGLSGFQANRECRCACKCQHCLTKLLAGEEPSRERINAFERGLGAAPETLFRTKRSPRSGLLSTGPGVSGTGCVLEIYYKSKGRCRRRIKPLEYPWRWVPRVYVHP